MFSWGLFDGFSPQKKKEKKKISCIAPLCVSLSVVKQLCVGFILNNERTNFKK
jgi:hypothetical protein